MCGFGSGALRPAGSAALFLLCFGVAGCEADPDGTSMITDPATSLCSIPEEQIFAGGPGPDGIPALNDPVLTMAREPDAEYLQPGDRVIGLVVEGVPIAVAHRVLWYHEIVNLSVGSSNLAVTYCPLTGSSLAFDRAAVGGAEFGVSGLLYLNNLIMYDRTAQESLWPQMARGARCGPRDGTELEMIPVVEMTWDGWRTLHPDTRVLANRTEPGRDFAAYVYPYGDYEELHSPNLLFPIPFLDTRRPLKERVLGIAEEGSAGLAFPFGALDLGGRKNVVQVGLEGRPVVILWDRDLEAAAAYRPTSGERSLTLGVQDGLIVDAETGSTWSVDGRAVAGPLAQEGGRLTPVAHAHVAFWFAWAAFHPRTLVWDDGAVIPPPDLGGP